jgi:hypothetical protein
MSDRKRMIAVDDDLTNVKETLERAGYKTTKITLGTMTNVAACVVSGLDSNYLGFHDTQNNKFSVIDAAGMSAEDVLEALREHEQTQNVH